jgi:hypothetical protein
MTNTESLELVDSAINECENELAKLSQLTDIATASRETIKRLEEDVADLHFNRGNLEPKARASRLMSSTAMLELERADLSTINAQIDAQSDRVVQVGQRAQSILQQVWSTLLASRKAGVEASLRSTFDFRQIHTPATEFSSAAFSVIEVEEIRNTLFPHRWLPAERGLAIHDARQLRTRSAALLTMANELSELSIVDVELTPVVRPRQATTSNQSGTLNVLAAAA